MTAHAYRIDSTATDWDAARIGHHQHLILDSLADAKGPITISDIVQEGHGERAVRTSMRALEGRGLVRVVYVMGVGRVADTHAWTITEAGLDALAVLEDIGRTPGVKAGEVNRG